MKRPILQDYSIGKPFCIGTMRTSKKEALQVLKPCSKAGEPLSEWALTYV